MNYHGLDLNLLVPLHVLLTERHVTRSADRLGITQPSMSAALARLRTLFGDPLLVRGAGGLARTARGDEILARLEQIMGLVDQIATLPQGFDPRTSRRSFTLIGTDFAELVLLPPLMAALAREAPGIEVVFLGPDPKSLDARMAAGTLDLALGWLPDAPGTLLRTAVFKEPFACVVRRGHPALADGTLALERFVELHHVQALMRDGTMYAAAIDTALARLGLVRKVSVWQPSFTAVVAVVAATDLVGTVPKRLAEHAAGNLPIVLHEPPVPLPAVEFSLFWHGRSRDDPGHRWLRNRIVRLLRSGAPPPGP